MLDIFIYIFSDQTLPPPVTAESGSMLVLLYSDTNYVMSGFSARYAASACPGACSGHGKCDPARGTCSCAEGFTGADCGVETCPGSCGAAAGWGWCQGGRCECNPGFVGDDCSLNVEVLVVAMINICNIFSIQSSYPSLPQNSVGNTWHLVSRGGPGRLPGRTLHAMAYDPGADLLYVHGGSDLNTVLGDTYSYNLTSNQWLALDTRLSEDVMEVPVAEAEEIDSVTEEEEKEDTSEEETRDTSNTRDKDQKKKTVKFTKYNSTTVSVQMFAAPAEKEKDNFDRVKRMRRMIPESVFKEEKTTGREDLRSSGPRLKGHKMVLAESGLLVFGGKTGEGEVSNTLWHYNLSTRAWTRRAAASEVRPPPVWLHCLVLMGDGRLYTLGGSTTGGRFVSSVHRIEAASLASWEAVAVRAGREAARRLTGHSCVRHEDNILVFGGLTTDMARFSKLSKKLFLFHPGKNIFIRKKIFDD